MTGQLFCQHCGAAYDPQADIYCSKCGTKISGGHELKKKLLEDLKAIEDNPPVYETVRFVSSLIVFIGWLIILFGWGLSLFVGALMGETLAGFISDSTSSSVLRNINGLMTFLSGSWFTIQGLFTIAFGQGITVLLDMRQDTNITKRLIRRMILLIAEKQA